MTVRIEEWRVKRRDTEEWMRHRQLPENLQERVLRFVQYKWLATRGVDEDTILKSLPLDLRREIQRHLCISLVRRVCISSYLILIFTIGALFSARNTKRISLVQQIKPMISYMPSFSLL